MLTLSVVAAVWLAAGVVAVLLDGPPEPSVAGVLSTVSVLFLAPPVLALATVPYVLGFLAFVARVLFLAGYRKAQEQLDGPLARGNARV